MKEKDRKKGDKVDILERKRWLRLGQDDHYHRHTSQPVTIEKV